MKSAIFPGSFDPITLAHIDIIERAAQLFKRVHVCLGVNSAKKNLLSLEQRLQIIEQIFQHDERIQTGSYTGLTVDYARKMGARAIIRGLRSVQDLEYERPIAQNNLELDPGIESVFLIARPKFTHISSTIVREIHQYQGRIDHLVPAEVLEVLHTSGRLDQPPC